MLVERGCLWNSFVMVGRVPAFLALIRRAAPQLDAAFAAVAAALGTSAEDAVIRALYARLMALGFSDGMLAARSANLAVLQVKGVQWSDWGAPERVMGTLERLGITPPWAERLAIQPA
jgi:mannose-1-phosphate guanylyltransferase